MLKKQKQLLTGALILVVIPIAIFLFSRLNQNILSQKPVSILNIPAPTGWNKVSPPNQIPTYQLVDFDKITTSTDPNRVDPAIEVTFESYKNSAETLLNGTGLYKNFDVDQTWNVINGYIILGITRPAEIIYLVIVPNGNDDYSYSFSITMTQANLSGLSTVPVNTDDIKVLQTMVQNFAESLPTSTLQ